MPTPEAELPDHMRPAGVWPIGPHGDIASESRMTRGVRRSTTGFPRRWPHVVYRTELRGPAE
jgi:hypothetical protein